MSSWTELPGPRARFMITIGAQKEALTCTLSEPPIGIEPMTYALRGGFRPSTTVQWVTPALLARLLVPPTSKLIQTCCYHIRYHAPATPPWPLLPSRRPALLLPAEVTRHLGSPASIARNVR